MHCICSDPELKSVLQDQIPLLKDRRPFTLEQTYMIVICQKCDLVLVPGTYFFVALNLCICHEKNEYADVQGYLTCDPVIYTRFCFCPTVSIYVGINEHDGCSRNLGWWSWRTDQSLHKNICTHNVQCICSAYAVHMQCMCSACVVHV